MLWTLLWIILILGAIIVLAIATFSTGKKGSAAINGASDALSVLHELNSRLDAMSDQVRQSSGPSVAADREPLVARVYAVRSRRFEKRKAARRRHTRTYRRWLRITGWSTGSVSRGNASHG